MKVWVTRASPGAEATAARLTELGYTPIVAPLLAVRPISGAKLDFKDVGALAFTSANAVVAFAARYALGARSLPVFAVGDATAEAVRRAGFVEVNSAGGDVHALAALIIEQRDSFRGTLLHPSAKQPAGDLAGALKAPEIAAVRTPIYDTVEAAELPPMIAEALVRGDLDAVLAHSPRGAQALARLIAGWEDGLAAFVLSEACAAPLRPLSFRHIAVAAAPNEASLLAQLTLASDGSTQAP